MTALALAPPPARVDEPREAILLAAIRTRAIRTWDDVKHDDADRLDDMIERGAVVEERDALWLPATPTEILADVARWCREAGLPALANNVRVANVEGADARAEARGVLLAVRAAREAAKAWNGGLVVAGKLARAEEAAERLLDRVCAAGAAKEG